VNFFRWFSSPRSRGDWKSPYSTFITLPWLLGAVMGMLDSRKDAAIASRQQTTFGHIAAHEPSNHDMYRYKFQAADEERSGLSNLPYDHADIGEEVKVYFDPSDPASNSLIDYSERSERDKSLVPFLLVGSGALATFILLACWLTPTRKS
jgi:hypothetical protein